MRTRKLGAAMLALAMLCSAVTGCGSSLEQILLLPQKAVLLPVNQLQKVQTAVPIQLHWFSIRMNPQRIIRLPEMRSAS